MLTGFRWLLLHLLPLLPPQDILISRNRAYELHVLWREFCESSSDHAGWPRKPGLLTVLTTYIFNPLAHPTKRPSKRPIPRRGQPHGTTRLLTFRHRRPPHRRRRRLASLLPLVDRSLPPQPGSGACQAPLAHPDRRALPPGDPRRLRPGQVRRVPGQHARLLWRAGRRALPVPICLRAHGVRLLCEGDQEPGLLKMPVPRGGSVLFSSYRYFSCGDFAGLLDGELPGAFWSLVI